MEVGAGLLDFMRETGFGGCPLTVPLLFGTFIEGMRGAPPSPSGFLRYLLASHMLEAVSSSR